MKPAHETARKFKILRAVGIASVLATAGAIMIYATGSTPPTLAISQVPLQLATPVRPQVVIAVTNSESMDGNMSGAIMTGSGFPGTPAANYASLTVNGSSPSNYTVPAGFTAPVSGTASGASAPYTVNSGGTLYDNSESRLNLAKATISNIVSTYLQTTDFALVSYDPPSVSVGNTWVYYMSPTGGFTFNNTGPVGTTTAGNGITSTTMVYNPCYHYTTTTSGTIQTYCSGIAGLGGITSSMLNNNQYMATASSSDDAHINDVFYSNSYNSSPFSIVFDYGTISGKNPETISGAMTPYYDASVNPGGYTLSDFKTGSVGVGYSGYNCCISSTGPTNAGFVPYTPQTMYSLRGFGYISGKTTSATNSSSAGGYVGMTNLGAAAITTTAVNTAIATFTTPLQPETSSTSTHEIKSTSGQSPVGVLINGANNAFVAPGGAGRPCASPKYMILVTDGQPTEDSSSNHYYWPPLGSDSATALHVTATFDISGTATNGALASSNDQAVIDAYNSVLAINTGATYTAGSSTILTNQPNQAGNANSNYVYTYVIGLGAGANGTSPVQQGAQNVLNALAYAGGTGTYYPATNPAQVQAALNAIMLDIQAHTLATVASSSNSTHLSSNSVDYQATFTSAEPHYLDWTGELYAAGLTANGTANGTQIWSARSLLTARTAASRAIATWTPTGAASGAGTPFEVPGTSGGGISAAQLTALQPSDTLGAQRLAYLRGDSTNELAPIGTGTFRRRTWHLGDIINSQPVYVGTSFGPYTTDSSYVTFATNNITRAGMLYVGSNDGMLHAFAADTGVEQFAFIPSGVFNNLANLTAPVFNFTHQYFVDGSPQVADVKFTDARGWSTVLIGGEGGGGRSIYALDVTNPLSNTEATANVAPSSSTRPWVLWEYNGDGSDSNMGLSYSIPTIAITNVVSSATGSANGFTVFFGNGYNSPNNSAVLYALNPQTGAKIAGIDLCAAMVAASTPVCNTSLPQGLSSVATGGGLPGMSISTVYAGDLQGNLWAIDVSNSLPSNWVVRCLYKGQTGAAQPITTTPQVTLAPNYPAQQGQFVMFATGQLLTLADLSNTTTQSFYGIWDVPGDATHQPYATSTLEQQTLTYVGAGPSPKFPEPILTSSANPVNWTTQRGWYVNLSTSGLASGFRVLSDPVLFNGGLNAVMNAPPAANTCGSTWSSFFLDLSYTTGGSFSTPHLDANGDGTITAADMYTTGGVSTAPVGIGLGSGFASGINNFGVSGISLVTIASLNDASSVTASQNAIAAAIAALTTASQNVSSTADIGLAVTAIQAAVNAANAAALANPGNQELTAAAADVALALAAALNAQSEIIAGGASNATLAITNMTTGLSDLTGGVSGAGASGSTGLAGLNLYRVAQQTALKPNYPWWQVQ